MSKKKNRADIKAGTFKHRKGIPIIKRDMPQPDITKREFIEILTKAGKPIERDIESNSER
jgi:hypothetical protein